MRVAATQLLEPSFITSQGLQQQEAGVSWSQEPNPGTPARDADILTGFFFFIFSKPTLFT